MFDEKLLPTEVVTVYDAAFETTADASGRVLVVDGEGNTRSADTTTSDGLHHSAVLLGLAPITDYEVYFEATDASGTTCVGPLALTTGSFPASLPLPRSTVLEADRAEGFHLLPVLTETAFSMIVLDRNGQAVWGKVLHETEDGGAGESTIPFTFRLRLDPFGRGVVFNEQRMATGDTGQITTMSWRGEVLESVHLEGGHTDFEVLPDGGTAILGWDMRSFDDDRNIVGDTLLLREPDGEVREIWNAWDTFTVDLSRRYPENFFRDGVPVEDWTHANGLTYDPSDDSFLITVTEPSSIVKVDRATGETTWVLGTQENDFRDMSPEYVNMPHGVQPIDGGLVVFNRTRPEMPDTCSHAADLALDLDAMAVAQTASLSGESCRKNGFLGGAHRLESGNTIITWSSYGLVEEYTPEGELMFNLAMDSGAGFGFGTYAAELPGALQEE